MFSESIVGVEIDLLKGTREFHPDFDLDAEYLAIIDGQYVAGSFSRRNRGYSFHGGLFNHQYDPPGTNQSGWERLWRLPSIPVRSSVWERFHELLKCTSCDEEMEYDRYFGVVECENCEEPPTTEQVHFFAIRAERKNRGPDA